MKELMTVPVRTTLRLHCLLTTVLVLTLACKLDVYILMHSLLASTLGRRCYPCPYKGENAGREHRKCAKATQLASGRTRT